MAGAVVTTTTVIGRIVQLVGACSIAVTLFVIAALLLAETRDWVRGVAKRRHRVERQITLASGQHARVIQPAPTPAAALRHRAQKQREIDDLERLLNLPSCFWSND